MAGLMNTSAEVAEHLLTAIDNAVPTDPSPEQLQQLAHAYAQVVSHMPEKLDPAKLAAAVYEPPKSVGRATRHSGARFTSLP